MRCIWNGIYWSGVLLLDSSRTLLNTGGDRLRHPICSEWWHVTWIHCSPLQRQKQENLVKGRFWAALIWHALSSLVLSTSEYILGDWQTFLSIRFGAASLSLRAAPLYDGGNVSAWPSSIASLLAPGVLTFGPILWNVHYRDLQWLSYSSGCYLSLFTFLGHSCFYGLVILRPEVNMAE